MRCRLMLLDEFPGTLLIIVSLLDVAGEAYLIAGGLDVNAFLSCVSNLDIVEVRMTCPMTGLASTMTTHMD